MIEGKPVSDEQIKQFCEYQEYELESIGKIAFIYKRKSDGTRHSLLKAGACSIEFHDWSPRHIPGEMSFMYCASCGLVQNPKNKNSPCKGSPGIRPFGKK